MSRTYEPTARGADRKDMAPHQVRRFIAMARDGYEARSIAESFSASDNWVRATASRLGVEIMDERSVRARKACARARAEGQQP